MDPLIRQVQLSLAAKNFNPGIIDGIWGPDSRKAMRAYESANRLPVTQTLTDTVLASLLGKSTTAPITWLDEATRLIGLKEGPGAKNNPVILDWADDLDIHYPADSIAWCGLFMAHCIQTALPDEPLPTNPLGARQWEKLGISCTLQLGAVATFWRGGKSSGLGHVGFLVGERLDAYRVRGGNTRDDVSDAWISKLRFVGARWPVTGPKPFNRPLPQGGAGALSTNEA